RGVIHVGAHEGQEFGSYLRAGCREVLFIEADAQTFQRLHAKVGWSQRATCVEQLVSDAAGSVTFHRMSMDPSSSMLRLQRPADIYPGITEVGTVERPAETLDRLLEREGADEQRFNILALDVQGAELLVLLGAQQTLQHVDAVLAEVNYEELYEGCALIHDL